MDILEKIFVNKPEVKHQYDYLQPFYKNGFRKSEKDMNQINRVSFVSEIRFGYYLHNRLENLRYDPIILGKTPDWVSEVNSEKILFEVKQLNPNEEIFNERIRLVKEDKYNEFEQLKKSYSIRDIFPYLPKIMQKEYFCRDLIVEEQFKLVICINFSNLKYEFFTDKDLIDYLDLKNNYEYFLQAVNYLDQNSFENFCNNVAGFLVIPCFGSDIFFIENEISLHKLSPATVKLLKKQI